MYKPKSMATKRKSKSAAATAQRVPNPNWFKPGNPDGRAGRKPGQVDISTRNAREAIARFVDLRADEFTNWLMQIEDPKDRCDTFIKLIEFHMPKLARTEVHQQVESNADEIFQRLAESMARIVDVRQQGAIEHKPEEAKK